MPEYRAFTAQYEAVVKNLLTPANVSSEFVEDKKHNMLPVSITAIWDTGATRTCIKPWLKDRLNLRLFDTQTRLAGVGGEISTQVALVNIRFKCDVEVNVCPVCVADFPGFADILIGMDIISMGDFAVCNTDKRTSFSFIIPSFHSRTDFTDITTTAGNYKNRQ